MKTQSDQPGRKQIDRLLGDANPNQLKDFLYVAAEAQLPSVTLESSYQHYVIETMPGGTQEVHRLAQYGERELAQAVQRPTFRFRWKCEKLLKQADHALSIEPTDPLFENEATLLWSGIASLAEHLGASSEVDEIITALLVTYAQFVKRTTPKPVIEALVVVFKVVATYQRPPQTAIDTSFDALENAGVDLSLPLSFGKGHA